MPYILYPSRSTIDPNSLNDSEYIGNEEFVTHIPVAISTIQQTRTGLIVTDPTTLGDPEFVGNEQFVPPNPVRLISLLPTQEGRWTIDPEALNETPVVVDLSHEWWKVTDQPTRPAPRALDEGDYTIDPTAFNDAEAISVDEFVTHNPVWLKHLRPVDEGFYVTDPESLGDQEFADLSWFSLHQQVFPVQRVAETFFTPDLIEPPISQDETLEWFLQPNEPTRLPLQFTLQGQLLFDLTTIGQGETVNIEEVWNQPIVMRPQPRIYYEGIVVPTDLRDDASFEWFRQLAEPVRKLLRFTDVGLFVIDPETLDDPTAVILYTVIPGSIIYTHADGIAMIQPSLGSGEARLSP